MNRQFLLIAGLAGLTGVALGAFGAHALRDRLSPEMLAIFQTGVQYQMIHALALLGLSLAGDRIRPTVGWLFTAGIVVFSGSLYLLALTGTRWLGAITPIGGLCFLAGWTMIVWEGARKPAA